MTDPKPISAEGVERAEKEARAVLDLPSVSPEARAVAVVTLRWAATVREQRQRAQGYRTELNILRRKRNVQPSWQEPVVCQACNDFRAQGYVCHCGHDGGPVPANDSDCACEVCEKARDEGKARKKKGGRRERSRTR